MKIVYNCFELNLSNEWRKVDENNFQTEEQDKEIYLSINRDVDLTNDKEILRKIILEQENKVKQIEDSNFKTKKRKIRKKNTINYGIIDQYDKSRLYRIFSIFYVNNGNIFRISFHDYYCESYSLSKKYFDRILATFKIDEDFCWEYGIDTNSSKLKKIHVITNDSFTDLNLYIDTLTEENGKTVITTKNQWNDNEVGLKVILEKQWNEQSIENSNQNIYSGKVEIQGTSPITENFVNQLSKIFNIKNLEYIKTDIKAKSIVFGDNPKEIKNRKIHMKLFINENNENLYTEIYMNIDLKNKVLELKEKDIEYRNVLVENLCK